ncbi:hypothetical protein [uncultured Hymenobacter sp.]|uniref:hypothetical protein n=1 Tax=uncultured Hymenobacter sp. TaxID=170016 RepID=UPI0035CB5264
MSLELLSETSTVSISYDNRNRWLYLDWFGDLTLKSVQESCLLIAKCFLSQSCVRILNDNTNVTSITPDVGIWLANDYLPYMHLAGVEHMAWVYSSSIDTQCCTDVALYNISTPVVALFSDIASAYSWLCSVKFKAPALMPTAKSVSPNQQQLKNYVFSLSLNALYVS